MGQSITENSAVCIILLREETFLFQPRLCTGRGPAGEQFEDTRIIGERQFLKAVVSYRKAQQLWSIKTYTFLYTTCPTHPDV